MTPFPKKSQENPKTHNDDGRGTVRSSFDGAHHIRNGWKT